MRTREEIDQQLKGIFVDSARPDALVNVELLLDIRELLSFLVSQAKLEDQIIEVRMAREKYRADVEKAREAREKVEKGDEEENA